MIEGKTLRIGPAHPCAWWDEHSPKGDCAGCAGQCDGPECGLHAAGCIFGGPDPYWLIADGCPLFHGEEKTMEHEHAWIPAKKSVEHPTDVVGLAAVRLAVLHEQRIQVVRKRGDEVVTCADLPANRVSDLRYIFRKRVLSLRRGDEFSVRVIDPDGFASDVTDLCDWQVEEQT